MVNAFDLFSVFAHSPADCEASPQNLKKFNFSKPESIKGFLMGDKKKRLREQSGSFESNATTCNKHTF